MENNLNETANEDASKKSSRSNAKVFLRVIGILVLAVLGFIFWYISIPILVIWLFFYKTDFGKKSLAIIKKSIKQLLQHKWSKKTKIIIISVCVAVILLIVAATVNGIGTPTFRDLPQKTTQQSITVKGFWVQDNASVKIFLNNNLVAEAQADKDGNFETPISLNEGDNSLYAIASYKNGEKKSSEKKITYIDQAKIDAQNKADADANILVEKIKQEELEAQQKIEEENRRITKEEQVAQQKIEEENRKIAEAEAAKKNQEEQDAQAKIDAENEKLAVAEEKRKAQEKAQAAKEDQLALANEEKDFKVSCSSISYNKLEKDPYSYAGENVYYKGKIEQAGSGLGSEWFRISITSRGYGYYTDTMWVTFPDSTEFVADDIVRFWGVFSGQHCYKSQLGLDICIPSVDAQYISK